MKLFNQEVLRIVLLDAKQRLSTMVDTSEGTLNETIAHPREIFRPVITHSAFSFILVHNYPSGDASPSEADLRLTAGFAKRARLVSLYTSTAHFERSRSKSGSALLVVLGSF